MTTNHRALTALAGLGLLLLTACGDAATPTTGGSMNMCLEGAEDCVDTPTDQDPGDSAADCEDGVECNDTGGGDASSACMVGMPDCNDTPGQPVAECTADHPDCDDAPSGDCPECDPDAQGVSGEGDERMNPSITIVQAFVGEVRAVEQAPGTITSPMQIFLQEAMVDGKQVTVSFSGGEAPCFVVDHADVTEEADRVFVTVWAGQANGATGCDQMPISLQTVTVMLDAELGSRLLLDGSRMHAADNV